MGASGPAESERALRASVPAPLHAREQARAAGMQVLGARAGELESGVPFGVVRQLLEPAIVGAPPERREALLSGAASQASSIFEPGLPPSGAAADAFPKLHGLFWLVGNLARTARLPCSLTTPSGPTGCRFSSSTTSPGASRACPWHS